MSVLKRSLSYKTQKHCKMKKSILNVGKELNKAEQKLVQGGLGYYHQCTGFSESECGSVPGCIWYVSPSGSEECALERNFEIPHIQL